MLQRKRARATEMGQCFANGRGKEELQGIPEEMWMSCNGPDKMGPALEGLSQLSNTTLTCLLPTPDPHSRVWLTSPDPDDPLSSYINANYIRVRSPIPVTTP